MFGFRFFNTSKEPEKLIPFTIGKGENRIAIETNPSSSKPSRIRAAFLDARFARIKRNKPADEAYVKPVTETQYTSASFQQERTEIVKESFGARQVSPEEQFIEDAPVKFVRYSKKLGGFNNRFHRPKRDRSIVVYPQANSLYKETSLTEQLDSTETAQLNFQSDIIKIERVDTGVGIHGAQAQSGVPLKAEVVSYRPKPLITRLTKHRSQQAKLANSTPPEQGVSSFSSAFSVEKEAFGSTANKPAAQAMHKWPQVPKGFTSASLLESMGNSSSSFNSVANAIKSSTNALTPQRPVSIKDLTGDPNFMRSEETKRAGFHIESETMDIKPWSELFNDSANSLNKRQSSLFKGYEWKHD
jgi:hypothetical protein